jgi:uncharacterized protein
MNTAVAQIAHGVVRHTRLRPAHHAFAYPTFFVLLPMHSLHAQPPTGLRLNRWGRMAFFDRDHGDGRGPEQGGALAWLRHTLAEAGIADADGAIWLQCYPRIWGYTFKPVSFWYCERADGTLRAVLVEVNNTFGERHCYLLDAPTEGAELTATKVFHVSPFCPVRGQYRFRFMRALQRTEAHQPPRVVVRIDYDDIDGPLIHTSVSGELQPLTADSARHVLRRFTWMTLGVVARIHWHALRLWLKRVPFFSKPAPPAEFITR